MHSTKLRHTSGLRVYATYPWRIIRITEVSKFLKRLKDLCISLVPVLFLVMALPACSQGSSTLRSPDGNIVFKFHLTKEAPVYAVTFKGKTLIGDSQLGLSFREGGKWAAGLSMGITASRSVDETYDLVVGKTKTVRDRHREILIPLLEKNGRKRRVDLRVRAFDDGVAYRYEFPEQENWTAYELLDENTTWKLAENPIVRALFWGHYNNDHEGLYHPMPLNKVKADTLMDLPALFEFPDKTYMAVTEANLRDYAGMYLSRNEEILTSKLSPLPGQPEIKVKATLPHRTPWRVMLIGDRIGTLLESNILTNLNEPTQFKDVSWIRPGKTTFHWWNGDIAPDTTFAPGVNFDFNKYYIDFAARNKISYHAVIGYGGFAWYQSDAPGYGEVGPNTDVTRTVPMLNMQQVCDYAAEKGVGIHVWVNWRAIYPDLERSFAQFEKWGIKGMMVDFLNRDDQEMVNIQEAILQKAAEHRLYIQFHGAYKPTGLHRTYPNEFTREGAYNYEQNKWRETPVSSEHDLDIVFTRLLAGATDYHLGGFRAVPEEQFRTQYTRPLMGGTRCHMLAMYVVLESYLTSLCDYPQAYEGEDGFEFLRDVPTTWDETVVPDASVGEYVTMARRKGAEWYVGSLNNSEARTVKVSLDFLPDGAYTATIYADTPEAVQNPNALVKEVQTVSNTDVIPVKMAAGGGQVIRLIKK